MVSINVAKRVIKLFLQKPGQKFIQKAKSTSLLTDDVKNLKYATKTDSFVKETSKLAKVEDLLKTLRSKDYICRQVDDTVLAGETFAGKSADDFILLKQGGINNIIDFRGSIDPEYLKMCEAAGIKYTHCPLDHIMGGKKSTLFVGKNHDLVDQGFVDTLDTIIKKVNQGNTYIGCQYGIDRTNFALVLNYLFNPKQQKIIPKLLPSDIGSRQQLLLKNLDKAKKIFKKLTPEQRKQLNLPDNYEEIFEKRLADIKRENAQPPSTNILNLIKKKLEGLVRGFN